MKRRKGRKWQGGFTEKKMSRWVDKCGRSSKEETEISTSRSRANS